MKYRLSLVIVLLLLMINMNCSEKKQSREIIVPKNNQIEPVKSPKIGQTIFEANLLAIAENENSIDLTFKILTLFEKGQQTIDLQAGSKVIATFKKNETKTKLSFNSTTLQISNDLIYMVTSQTRKPLGNSDLPLLLVNLTSK